MIEAAYKLRFQVYCDDCRFLDPPGVIVGLSAKGKRAHADTSGFVVRA